MTLLPAYLIVLIGLLGSTIGAQNGTSIGTSLPVRERYRRLIPYFTYYLGGAQGQQYRPPPMAAVSYVPVPPQYRTGGPPRHLPQPSPLTKMIIQNYLTLSKVNGNPRLQTRINPQDLNYYVPLPRPIHHAVGPLDGQDIGSNTHYPKPNIVQYVKPVPELEYNKQPDVDYEREEENEGEYEKPLDTIIQYANPQVQQYISTFDNKIPIRDYGHPQSPVEYPGNPIRNEAISLKPRLPFHYKAPETIKFASKHPKNHFPTKSEVTSHKLEPAVTIMQSQELDVETLASTTPSPIRYHATYVSRPEANLGSIQQHNYDHHQEQEQEYDETISEQNLDNILQGVTIPNKITPQNLDESIRTLSKLLQILQKANSLPNSAKDIISTFPKPGETKLKERPIKAQTVHPDTDEGGTPGRPGVDYPAYDEIPPTRFSCKEQRYKGFFGDPETGCQVWHYCDLNGGQASFLCPNGTIFSQVALTCDWWFNVKCASTAQLYVLNERLYKYILPQKLSFPEDYSGPLVDHYLTLKFKEIEEKNKNKTEANRKEDKEKQEEEPMTLDTTIQNKIRSIG